MGRFSVVSISTLIFIIFSGKSQISSCVKNQEEARIMFGGDSNWVPHEDGGKMNLLGY